MSIKSYERCDGDVARGHCASEGNSDGAEYFEFHISYFKSPAEFNLKNSRFTTEVAETAIMPSVPCLRRAFVFLQE